MIQKYPLRFNFGFLLETVPGTRRKLDVELPYVGFEDGSHLEPLHGLIKASRTNHGVYIEASLLSIIDMACGRCLKPYGHSITIKVAEHFSYPPTPQLEDTFSMQEDGHIDLTELVREGSIFAMPVQPVCRPDCQGLCVDCGKDFNNGNCECSYEHIDPRMAVLKQLLENDNPSEN